MEGDISDHSKAAYRQNCEIIEGGTQEGELQAAAEGETGILGFDNENGED